VLGWWVHSELKWFINWAITFCIYNPFTFWVEYTLWRCGIKSKIAMIIPTGTRIGFMPSCTTSWTSASSLFPVCHYWPNWLIQVVQLGIKPIKYVKIGLCIKSWSVTANLALVLLCNVSLLLILLMITCPFLMQFSTLQFSTLFVENSVAIFNEL